jgi:hypothetical protein
MSTNDTPMSFDDIDVSGVVAAPTFSDPPSGQYLVDVSMTQKVVAEKRAIVVDMELVEVIELGTQHTEKPADVGQKFNSLLFVDKPERIPYVKRDLAVFFESVGTQSVNVMTAAVQKLRCKIVWSYDRNDYARVISYEIV